MISGPQPDFQLTTTTPSGEQNNEDDNKKPDIKCTSLRSGIL